MPNRLAKETSPYLLQHQNNPVDWFPWGEEAFAEAKRLDRPVFLSVGYSACHWCHVMEHESFESEEIAKKLNDGFISIKVDREERPDVDQIYMTAVQAITGRGGWPMSVFLTHDRRPFYGGTYWPPKARANMPGFDQVLDAVQDAWKNRRDGLTEQADQLTEHLRQSASVAGPTGAIELTTKLVVGAESTIFRQFDAVNGGFGGAPKFPHPMDLRVLLRIWRRSGRAESLNMVTLTLDKMAGGGIYDHLGGGFHRYSVDARWLVPHFEKMLYDNALLVPVYLEAYQATGRESYARTARETLDYVLREMTGADGGFYSTQDADSEGEEGKFYVWSLKEVESLLGEAAKSFAYCYDVTEQGNFEGHNILNLPKTFEQCAKVLGRDESELAAELALSRAKLFDVRKARVHPGLDDKVLVSWNGLMIAAMAHGSAVLGDPRYLQAAQKSADFILAKMRRPDGRLLHTYRNGQAKHDGYLDDYACLTEALIALYEIDGQARWIDEATKLADVMLARFADADKGGFFYTADDHEELIARTKDVFDNATPSGNGMATTALVRLAKLTGNEKYADAAARGLRAVGDLFDRAPTAVGQSLLALDTHLGPTQELVLTAANPEERTKVFADLHRRYWPNKVVAQLPGIGASPHLKALTAGKQAAAGDATTLFVCENFACQAPAKGIAAVTAEFDKLAPRP